MTEDKKPIASEVAARRTAWERPELRRMEAGAAENAAVNAADAAVVLNS